MNPKRDPLTKPAPMGIVALSAVSHGGIVCMLWWISNRLINYLPVDVENSLVEVREQSELYTNDDERDLGQFLAAKPGTPPASVLPPNAPSNIVCWLFPC